MFGFEMKETARWNSYAAARMAADTVQATLKDGRTTIIVPMGSDHSILLDGGKGEPTLVTYGLLYAICNKPSDIGEDPYINFPFIDPAPRNIVEQMEE